MQEVAQGGGRHLPEMIGRYRVVGVLGSGGFATVFLAEDPTLQVNVAIKVLSESMSLDPELRERFISEARVMRQLADPGLVTVHDINEHEGRPYFVMEHCARGTLTDRLAELARPLSFGEAMGLATALHACTSGIHQAGFVHRDLKPSNYLIRQTRTRSTEPIGALLHGDEELVVADFGLAKVVDLAATRLSMAGGTPGYSAPEQFRGDPTVDSRADVYALSAILVGAMAHAAPAPVMVGGQDAFDAAALDATGPFRPELVRGLSFDRQERQPDVTTWHRALEEAARQAPPSANQTVVAEWPPPAPGPGGPPSDPGYPPPAARGGPGPDSGRFPPPVVPPAAAPDSGPSSPTVHQPGRAPDSGPSSPTVHQPGRAPDSGPYPPPGPQSGPGTGSGPSLPAVPAEQPWPVPEPFRGGGSPEPRIQPAPASDGGSRRRGRPSWLLPVGAVAAAILLVAGAFGLGLRLPGPGVDGPTIGAVGQEAVFAVDGDDAVTWRVNGQPQRAAGRTIQLVPREAGTITVEATTTLRRTEVVYEAVEPDTALRIEGPGLIRVGEPAAYQAGGASGSTFTWTIGSNEFPGTSVELSPDRTGEVTIRLASDTGEEIERTVTVVAAE